MLGFSNVIHLLGWASARYAVMVMAPTVFFTCILSAIRGYYQGMADMVPTAISQIVEALGKLVFGLLLAFGLSRRGYSVEVVVAGAIGGVMLGSLLSCIYVGGRPPARCAPAEKRCWRRKAPARNQRPCAGGCFNWRFQSRSGASVLSVTNLIDAFMVVWRMTTAGLMTEPEAQLLLRRLYDGAQFLQPASDGGGGHWHQHYSGNQRRAGPCQSGTCHCDD